MMSLRRFEHDFIETSGIKALFNLMCIFFKFSELTSLYEFSLNSLSVVIPYGLMDSEILFLNCLFFCCCRNYPRMIPCRMPVHSVQHCEHRVDLWHLYNNSLRQDDGKQQHLVQSKYFHLDRQSVDLSLIVDM